MLKVTHEGMISNVPGRGAYMPVISVLPDGTFLACQHVGAELGSPDNHIQVLRSTDAGNTWTNQRSIHGPGPAEDGWAYRGPDITWFQTVGW